MKINELMVGDWVYIHEPECKGHRIDAIDELDGQVGADGEVYDECDIRPIPLTEEILVKNGFNKGKTISGTELFCCEVTHQLAGDGFEVQRITIYHNWVVYVETTTVTVRLGITYVHQLQHLLRLCGIEKEIEL